MRRLIPLFFFFAMFSSCGHLANKEQAIKSKSKPEYTTVNPTLQAYVNSYREISARNHIYFSNVVSIGFKKIAHRTIVGLCHYGHGWREIDVDIDYWNRISETSRMTLVYHELTHCYCGRDHDYGFLQRYKEAVHAEGLIDGFFGFWKNKEDDPAGFMEDGCPLSIMYPYVVGDACVNKHKEYYLKEMLDRCEPY